MTKDNDELMVVVKNVQKSSKIAQTLMRFPQMKAKSGFVSRYASSGDLCLSHKDHIRL